MSSQFIELEVDSPKFHPCDYRTVPVDAIGEARPCRGDQVEFYDRQGKSLGRADRPRMRQLLGEEVVAAQPGWRVVTLLNAKTLAYDTIIAWRVSSSGVTPVTPHRWLNQDLDRARVSALALPPEGRGDAYDVCPLERPGVCAPTEEAMLSWLRGDEQDRARERERRWVEENPELAAREERARQRHGIVREIVDDIPF